MIQKRSSIVSVAVIIVGVIMVGVFAYFQNAGSAAISETIETQSTNISELEETEESTEDVVDFVWSCSNTTGQTGKNEYTDILLSSSIVSGEAADYMTFANAESKMAYVVAGALSEDGIKGSLWLVSVDNGGAVEHIKQNVTVQVENAQYFILNDKQYVVLHFREEDTVTSRILCFSNEADEELLPTVTGEKRILPNGVIQCMSSLYASCMVETDEQGMALYTWGRGESVPYTFCYNKDGKIRGVSAEILSLEQLQEYSFGEEVLKLVEERYPNGEYQYILRESGELNVNIYLEQENRAEFFFMNFQVEEDERDVKELNSGKGAYMQYMTGEASKEAFLQAFGGEGRLLPQDISIMSETVKSDNVWKPYELEKREQSYVYGTEYELTEEESTVLSGVILDYSEEWDAYLRSISDFDEAEWENINQRIFMIQQTEGFKVYATRSYERMLIHTPNNKYVLVEGAFTSNYGVQPRLLEYDFDKDGSKELAVIGLTEHGTGVCVEYLYMVDQSRDGKWYTYRVMYDWYEEKFAGHIASRYTENGLELIFDGVPQGYHAYVLEDETAKHYAGSQIAFYFDEEKIICKADLMIYSDTQFAGLSDGSELHMELSYLGDGKWEEAECTYKVDEFARKQMEEWIAF